MLCHGYSGHTVYMGDGRGCVRNVWPGGNGFDNEMRSMRDMNA